MFGTRKLGKTSTQRKALLRQLATDLLEHGKLETTFYRAKEIQPVVEKLITLGKTGTLHARRQALATLPQPKVVTKLFSVVAEATKNRQGGYTRIVKLGQRMTDSAPMALIEIIDLPQLSAPEAPATTVGTGSSEAPAAEAPATEAPAEEQK